MGLSRYYKDTFDLNRKGTPTVDDAGVATCAWTTVVLGGQGMLYQIERGQKTTSGTLALVESTMMLVPAGVDALPGDQLTCGGKTYTVGVVSPFKRALQLTLAEAKP